MSKFSLTQTSLRKFSLLSTNWIVNSETHPFINIAKITDKGQIKAVDTLITDLKAINTLEPNFVNFVTPADSNCIAIYPFVGSTAIAHKYNLINPVDSDAAYRLTFAGGLTHSQYGVKGDGTNTTNGDTHISTSLLGETTHGFDISIKGAGEPTLSFAMRNNGSPDIFISGAGDYTRDAPVVINTNGQDVSHPFINLYNSSVLINVNRRSNAADGADVYFGSIKTTIAAATANIRHISDITLFSMNGSYAINNYIDFAAFRRKSSSDTVMAAYIEAITKFQYNLMRLALINLNFQGHSLFTSITGGLPWDWLPIKTMMTLNNNIATNIKNCITSGSYSGGTVDNLISNKATTLDPYLYNNYGVKNICPIWIGTNDITNVPGCGMVAYNKLKSYYNSVIADGWTGIVITMCEYGGGVGQQESERIIYNNMIRTDLMPEYLIDTDLIPELSDSTDLTYFMADQVHLTAAGNQAVADILVPMIAAI